MRVLQMWQCTLALALAPLGAHALAPAPADVPSTHWAARAVQDVVSRGVMAAPGGKFQGSRYVTRRELAVTVERLARSLQRGSWSASSARPVPESANVSLTGPVTRYDLAAAISRLASLAARGLPRDTGKAYFLSEALPPRSTVRVPKSDPAYSAIAFLAANRMAFPPSVLLAPSNQPVTGAQVSLALAQMIAGLNDRLTDEPQDREEIAPPPSREPHGHAPHRE